MSLVCVMIRSTVSTTIISGNADHCVGCPLRLTSLTSSSFELKTADNPTNRLKILGVRRTAIWILITSCTTATGARNMGHYREREDGEDEKGWRSEFLIFLHMIDARGAKRCPSNVHSMSSILKSKPCGGLSYHKSLWTAIIKFIV